jgi:hypothetical protein
MDNQRLEMSSQMGYQFKVRNGRMSVYNIPRADTVLVSLAALAIVLLALFTLFEATWACLSQLTMPTTPEQVQFAPGSL